MLSPFERGLVAHLIADWLLQNDWMAKYKSSLLHPASWVHATIHTLFLSLALGWRAGLILGLIHLLVDTRVPLRWWQQLFRQTTEGPAAMHTAIWADQVVHITTIAAWIILAGV